MHELKTGLQTYGCYARHYPPCSHAMLNDKVIGPTKSTRRKVREKILRLAMPYWMGVLWPSWGGRIILSWYGRVLPSSPLVTTVIFQNCLWSKLKPTKNENVVCFAAMLCSKTMSVELHGRSHPASRIYEGDLLSGLWTLWVSGVEGVQGFLRVPWLQRFHESKILTISRVSGFQRSKG